MRKNGGGTKSKWPEMTRRKQVSNHCTIRSFFLALDKLQGEDGGWIANNARFKVAASHFAVYYYKPNTALR